ncbi:hypothetical protein [Planococcus beigongshangi]|uniref:hypothetical protein n=1 Tax=Planococcus beigongshangi TaxID=2782536 RepID=UPI00193B0FB4|nr:hypothetical protein [Planococcus beigongshangi]
MDADHKSLNGDHKQRNADHKRGYTDHKRPDADHKTTYPDHKPHFNWKSFISMGILAIDFTLFCCLLKKAAFRWRKRALTLPIISRDFFKSAFQKGVKSLPAGKL